jgi:hypothetical protein
MIVLEELSTDPRVTHSRLRLDDGDIYAASNMALDQGYLEVKTPVGTASLDESATGSAMIVGVHDQTGTILIACLQGRVIIQDGNSLTVLSPGTALNIERKDHIQHIISFEGQPPGTDAPFREIVEKARTAVER